MPAAWSRVEPQAGLETVIIVASGPSLRKFPFARLRGKGFVIAVNHASRWASWADCWLTVDTMALWTRIPTGFHHKRLVLAAPLDFGQPDAVCACDRRMPNRDLTLLKRVNAPGLREDASELAGLNSAFGALNYAYHLRPKRIVLFGVDGTQLRSYFYGLRYGTAKQNTQMEQMPALFRSALSQLKAQGIEVLNASAESAVTCFPRCSPMDGLASVSS